MKGPAMAIALFLIFGPAIGVGTLLLAVFGRGRNDLRDPLDEPENWCRTTAEVRSVWGPRNRMFVLVRYRVGASLIVENDVPHPLGGATLRVGQRVSIRYHPMHPAQVVLHAGGPGDIPHSPGSGPPPPERADPHGSGDLSAA